MQAAEVLPVDVGHLGNSRRPIAHFNPKPWNIYYIDEYFAFFWLMALDPYVISILIKDSTGCMYNLGTLEMPSINSHFQGSQMLEPWKI